MLSALDDFLAAFGTRSRLVLFPGALRGGILVVNIFVSSSEVLHGLGIFPLHKLTIGALGPLLLSGSLDPFRCFYVVALCDLVCFDVAMFHGGIN